jgi:hypothetical protein
MAPEAFTPPPPLIGGAHHDAAAAGNDAATRRATEAMVAVLDGESDVDKILLRAAAGAGKSHALMHMVTAALESEACTRVAVTAFANKQTFPLAARLGDTLGAATVCLFVAESRLADVPQNVFDNAAVATKANQIPDSARVVVGVSHKLGAMGERGRLLGRLGEGSNGESPFDVLFVDEAWQLPLHRYVTVEKLAPLTVGVGDVGQLPPIDPGQNPWRGDPGYNPYRAWPTQYEGTEKTFDVELPAVWRPTAEQLPLWRAFYPEWDRLSCVAAPGDRGIELPELPGPARSVWHAVATGDPVLLEVEGLDDAEAPDIDPPLLAQVEALLEPLLASGFATTSQTYDALGRPQGDLRRVDSATPSGDPLVVVLATRNQAVDDAADMVARLTESLGLPEGVIEASTVDSWQGQTNAITIAIHPLSGAEQLDDFNSAFGRLAVTCTRATHGLLMVARSGLATLLGDAPARPGTPLGEPGNRTLPRQTHQRILAAFRRGTLRDGQVFPTPVAEPVNPVVSVDAPATASPEPSSGDRAPSARPHDPLAPHPDWKAAAEYATKAEYGLLVRLVALANSGLAAPSVGDEVNDGVPLSLSWVARKVTVRSDDVDDGTYALLVDDGWTVVEPDPEAIRAVLTDPSGTDRHPTQEVH